MRMLVLGAGAMGCLFGGLLSRAGQDVTLVDINRSHVDAINTSGLRLQLKDAEYIVPVPAVTPDVANTQPDLLILFTKTLHTEQALAGAQHLIGSNTFVLSVQNGLGNLEKITKYVSLDRVLLGTTTFPADLLSPGHVRSNGRGHTHIMSANGKVSDFIHLLITTLNNAGLETVLSVDIESTIWAKVAFNAAINAICAVSGVTPGTVGDSRHGVELIRSVVDEVKVVAALCGVALDKKSVNATIDAAIAGHRDHAPSMLQDLRAGRLTEIDALNGEIAKIARSHGIEAPVNETLWRLVRLADPS